MMPKWPKNKLQAIIDGAQGKRLTDVECTSENAARNLRFALYKHMAGKLEHRISVHGKTVRLVPLVEQIKEVRHSS